MRYSSAREIYWAPSSREGDSLSCPSSQPMPVVARAKTLQNKPDPGFSCPGVEDRLVKPEVSRDEILRGEKLVALPANFRHAHQHTRLDYVVSALVREGHLGTTDMLTRVSEGSDFATDTAVCKAGVDPQTGQRFLEELSFEIVDTQSDAEIQARAEELKARGVRRVFAIFVRESKKQVCEWRSEKNAFEPLGLDDEIDDPVFVKPILVKAILDAAEADNEVARALEAKKNPVFEQRKREAFEEGRREGEREGERRMLLRLLERRFGEVPPHWLERVRAADSDLLALWLDRASGALDIEAVFL